MIKPLALSAVVALALWGTGEAAHAQLVGMCTDGSSPGNNRIFEINPATGILSNIRFITLPGFTINSTRGLAVQPGTRTVFGVIDTGTFPNDIRRLVTINHQTGVATLIGTMSNNGILSIAFGGPDGSTLYGVTIDGAAEPETLFTIDTTTGACTPAFALGNGNNGEIIASKPGGLLYHNSGQTFETVDPVTQAVTPISGSFTPCTSMAWHAGVNQMFAAYNTMGIYRINPATGARTFMADMSFQISMCFVNGMAYIPPAPPSCGPADLGSAGGASSADGQLDNNDFIAFINRFFALSPAADLGVAGGAAGSDGLFDNNDFIAFINHFFAGCP